MRRSFLLCHILVHGLWLMIILELANEAPAQVFSPEEEWVLAGSSECPVYSVLGFPTLCYQVKEQRGKAGGLCEPGVLQPSGGLMGGRHILA